MPAKKRPQRSIPILPPRRVKERKSQGKTWDIPLDVDVVEAVPIPIVLVDSRGVIRLVNKAWKRFAPTYLLKGTDFGLGANYFKLCEKTCGVCVTEAKVVAKGLRTVLAGTRDLFTLEYPCPRGDQRRWFQVTVTPVPQKEYRGAVIMHRNVTERRQVQEDLKNSERRLSQLMQNLPGMVYRCRNDRDWTMEFVSEGSVALTGYESTDLLNNRNVSFGRQVVHPDDRDRVWKETQSALRKKQPYHYTYRIRTADGVIKWVWEQGQGVYSSKGQLMALEGFITDVTRQKENEETLQANEERLDLALFGARLGVWDWNVQTGKVHFNERWAKMLGYDKDEIESTIQAWEALMHPDDRPRVMKILQAHLDGHIPFYQTEHRLRTKSGKWKWVLDTGKVVSRDKSGAPIRATGIHQDISERKDMERELHQEREFMDAILETAGALVIVLDRQGRIVRFNRACEQLTGLSSNEVLGQSIWKMNLIPSQEIKEVKRVFRKLQTEVSTCKSENHWVAKDHTERLIAWANTVIKGEANKVEYVIGTGIDISERKQMEMALRESQERFQAFMDHAPTVAFIKDKDGRYVYVNRPFERKFGRGQAECLGRTDHELFPPEVARMFKETDHETLKYRKILASEETTLDEQGKHRHWVVLKFPIRGTSDDLVGGIALDITSRKEAEQAVREREQQLRRSQEQLQALGRRLVTAQEEERRRISRELHDDMNQRLAVLALTIQSTQQGFPAADPSHATLQKLYDEVSSISDDVRRLAYQLHPSVLDDLGLRIALQSFVQDFIQWSHIRATFRAQNVPDDIPQDIAACVYRITQESLRNVARHARASQVTVTLTGEKGGLRLSIIDNGKGFDSETVRTDRRGLGLVGMKERVSYVNGTFVINSIPGNGTEIDIWVPLS